MNKGLSDSDIQAYIHDPAKKEALYKKTLWIVVLSQIFGGAGLAAGITVGALLANDLLGTEGYAGLPIGLLTFGSAMAAYTVGRSSQRFGRRLGLSGGFLIGGLGAIGVISAAAFENIPLLFLSFLIYGAGTASNLQARYAGTDLAGKDQRAKAVSIALVSTTFGAVAGPNLVGVMGEFAVSVGLPALAGPFILAAAAYLLAGIVLFLLLKPDPLLVAAKIAVVEKASMDPAHSDEVIQYNRRGVVIGAAVMVTTQIVMVAVMTMTPVHMGAHGHELEAVGLVISLHIAAMYLPSLITGVLVDKVGRGKMAVAAGVTLLLAGLGGALAPGESLFWMIVALVLLGLGWNFGLISGTSMLVDSTEPAVRAKTQGAVDVLVALSGAAGGIFSGMVVAGTSYGFLSIAGGMVALLLLPAVYWMNRGSAGSVELGK
ncbi:MFS transporter [Jeotgalibacillus sp. R-1-5s-1]|uniref:MFS transporter n=1 Tax=Jeotgalibacillus sp. R-1-5s-1 TaxID=2555897 RepID=UPI00106D31D7|nr:MFS transporter [Jeotgalibacillus sp. R-1-5s-1]TFD93686.1 MFS transporter [Jeotgalibacillus sp. R-1-5s-1]